MNDEQKKVKVLVVEDELAINKVYVAELQDQGFDVMSATNGAEGLQMAESEKPNIILLDIMMPVMDGLAVMSALRAGSEYGKNVPIILLTNLSPDEEKIMNSVTKNEPAYYIVKSDSTLSDVIAKVKERLSRVV